MHPSQAFIWCMWKMFNIRNCTSYAIQHAAHKALGMSIAHVCGVGFLRFWANRKETFALRKWIVPDRIFKRSKIRGLRSSTNIGESHFTVESWYILRAEIDRRLFIPFAISGLRKNSFRYKIYVNKRVCTNVLFVQRVQTYSSTHVFAPVDCKVAKIQKESKKKWRILIKKQTTEKNMFERQQRSNIYNTKVILFILGLTNTFNPNPKNFILISFNFIFFRLRVKSHWIADQQRTAWIECKRIKNTRNE